MIKKEAVKIRKYWCLVIVFLLFCSVSYASGDVFDIDFSGSNKKVIVTLKEPDNQVVFVPLSYGSDVKSYQKLQMQKKVFKKLNSHSSVKNQFKSINGFSAEIDEESYLNLLSDPNVLSVELDKPVVAFLASSVPISGANKLWDNIYSGVNLTGAGQTVCVIDTGVDYTHADLGGCIGLGCKVLGGYDFVNSDSNPIDDHGHGTHVSGMIISTNSINRGVAPGANIVSLKALDYSGSGSISSVVSSIDWCISHKDDYNISVVSMSLGDPTFLANSTCDNYDTSLKTIINSAVANDITIFVASGNDGNVTGISAPSCMSNATSVGSITDSLVFSSFSNRGDLLDFVTPGSSITSTKLGGGFVTASGTSMATPYAAGAAILLRSFKMLENGTYLSVDALNNLIRRTGFIVSDSGKNYTGVNVSTAFLELDLTSPTVSLNIVNGTINVYNDSIHFELLSSENVYDVVLNFNGSNYSMDGAIIKHYFDLYNLTNGIYSYSISGRDVVGHGFNVGVNYFRIGNVVPNVTLFSPSNLTLFLNEGESLLFNLTYSDSDGDNVSVSWLRDGVVSSVLDNYAFVANETDEGYHNITAVVNDGYSSSFVTWNLNVSVNHPPIFYDSLNITVNETEVIVLNVSAYDPEGQNLSFIFSSPFDSNGHYTTALGSSGNYSTTVIASDSVKNSSKIYYYQIILNISSSTTSSSSSGTSNSTSSSSGSSGGGSAGGVTTAPIAIASIPAPSFAPVVIDEPTPVVESVPESISDTTLDVVEETIDVTSISGFTGALIVDWLTQPKNSPYIVSGLGIMILLSSMYIKFRKSKTKKKVVKTKLHVKKKVKSSSKPNFLSDVVKKINSFYEANRKKDSVKVNTKPIIKDKKSKLNVKNSKSIIEKSFIDVLMTKIHSIDFKNSFMKKEVNPVDVSVKKVKFSLKPKSMAFNVRDKKINSELIKY